MISFILNLIQQLDDSGSNSAKEMNVGNAFSPQPNSVFPTSKGKNLSIVLKADILVLLQICLVHLNVFNRKFSQTAMNWTFARWRSSKHSIWHARLTCISFGVCLFPKDLVQTLLSALHPCNVSMGKIGFYILRNGAKDVL